MPVHIFALSADEGSLMQRVTRLITPHTPTRFGWKVPVATLAVLCCGASLASLASQVTPAMDHALADAIPTIASSANSGASSFGINGPFLGGWRSYSESVTPQGHVTETYTVNGHPARIDASARAWIASKYAAASHVLTPPPIPSPPPIPTQPPTPSLANQATGHWWQIAGTSFEIRAPFAGGQRVYKTSTSLSGDLRESYTVNDRPAPIDAGVRQWIRAAKLRQLPPMPPMPAMPPVPATPPVPPMPGTHS